MENEQEAEIAKLNLDGDVILQDGSKMNVYYSNLQQVSFHNSNSGGVGNHKNFSHHFNVYRLPSLEKKNQQFQKYDEC